MSVRELSRFTTTNDSNIPILKKTLVGTKKSKVCSKLPELHKYIETIIRANNEFDSKSKSLSNKEKFPKGIQFGKQAVCKGLENKIKHEKLKFDLISNRHKSKRQTSKKFSEAVSRGVEVLHKFFSEFEDPRNWKTRNSSSHLKIEKLIEKIYPNPYTIRCENECRNSDTQVTFEEVKKDDLGDETLYDVFISKVDAETQDDLDKTNTELYSDDFQIILSERGNISTTADLALSFENLHQSLPRNKINNEKFNLEKETNASKLNIISKTPNKSSDTKHSDPVSTVSSRVSSIESMNKMFCKESQFDIVKKNFFKENIKKSSKEILPEIKKSKPLTASDENYNDYDLGKLRLLSLSDSEGSASTNSHLKQTEIKNKNKNNFATDDFVNEISSEICNEISKTSDLNDLLQIYEVMNKATESFLYLTSIKKYEFEKSAEVLDDVANKDPVSQAQKNTGNPKVKNFCLVNNSEDVHSFNTNEANTSSNTADYHTKNKSNRGEEKEERRAVENCSQNFMVEDKEKKNFDPEKKSEPENEKLEIICDNEEEKLKFLNMNDSEETERMVEDEIYDANQKINEVLQFMNDCLLKYNDDEKLLQQEKKNCENKRTNSSEIILKNSMEDKKQKIPSTFQTSNTHLIDKKLIKNSSQTGFLNPEEPQNNQPEHTNKNQNIRIRCKRKSKTLISIPQVLGKKTSASSQHLSVDRNEASTSDFDMQPIFNAESVVICDENIVQVAESQNELGAYTEEPQESTIILKEDSRILKPVIPLSTKVRRSQPKTYKTLKDALETEEKLLKLNKPEPKKLITYNPESQILLQDDRITSYSPNGGFESVNSSFVLRISPFTKNLTTATVMAPSLSIPKPLSLFLIDLSSWNLKPLSQPTKKYPIEKLFVSSQIEYETLKYMYSFKVEVLSIVNNTCVSYYARPICFAALVGFPKVQNEYSLKYSQRQIKVRPLKNFSVVNLKAPGTSGLCVRNTLTFTTSKSNLLKSSDSGTSISTTNKPMEALIRAIQETESVFLHQQHNYSGNNPPNHFESFCSCRSSEILNKETSDNELEKENDKKKVQDLLLRTYKLQKKLQQHLCNISQVQPRLSRSLIKQGLGVTASSPDVSITSSNVTPKKLPPLTQKFLQLPTAEKKTKTDEAITVNVQMVDRSTTYFPPTEDKTQTICEKSSELNYKANNSPCIEKKEETPLNFENDDDDRSSTYSFKSSNDFSETNEIQNFIQESTDRVTNGDVIKKIFSQIELLKQSVDTENLERQDKKLSDKITFKDNENLKDNKLTEFDSKNPAKVLKTVFKGTKSSTELTIGLKDVPMTQVSNISVEKTKFSPNHTKISICILKESPNETNNSDNSDSKLLSNKVSSYFFDHMRPSLSMCQTEYSKVEDNASKNSQNLNEESEGDEDDFKSVSSTFADSNAGSSPKPEKLKAKNQAVVKITPPKNFTKHKFDFYRKMDMNVEGVRVRQKLLPNSLWNFRELEPLKQALTELQIRMKSIKRDAILSSNDYYERALKLAKMSAGYCQSCGTRAVIPDDTFGYYKTLLPRRHAQHRRNRHFKTTLTPNSSFYSFRSSNAEVSGQFRDLHLKGSTSFSLNRTTHSNRTVLRSSLQDMPIVFDKM